MEFYFHTVEVEGSSPPSPTIFSIAVFSDREKGKVALFNAKEFTAYANVRAIIDNWTAQIVTALNQIKEGGKVNIKSSDAFTPLDY